MLKVEPGDYTTRICINSNRKSRYQYIKGLIVLRKGEKSRFQKNKKQDKHREGRNFL